MEAMHWDFETLEKTSTKEINRVKAFLQERGQAEHEQNKKRERESRLGQNSAKTVIRKPR